MSRNSLVVNLRFMDSAISRLELVPYDGTISVDGEHIAYEPEFMIRSYKTAKELPARQYLHMLLHCVFQHFFIDSLVDQKCWNLACDMLLDEYFENAGQPAVFREGLESPKRDKVIRLFKHWFDLDDYKEAKTPLFSFCRKIHIATERMFIYNIAIEDGASLIEIGGTNEKQRSGTYA